MRPGSTKVFVVAAKPGGQGGDRFTTRKTRIHELTSCTLRFKNTCPSPKTCPQLIGAPRVLNAANSGASDAARARCPVSRWTGSPGRREFARAEFHSNIEGPGTDLNTVTTTVVSSQTSLTRARYPRQGHSVAACVNWCSLSRARRPHSSLVCHGRLLS